MLHGFSLTNTQEGMKFCFGEIFNERVCILEIPPHGDFFIIPMVIYSQRTSSIVPHPHGIEVLNYVCLRRDYLFDAVNEDCEEFYGEIGGPQAGK